MPYFYRDTFRCALGILIITVGSLVGCVHLPRGQVQENVHALVTKLARDSQKKHRVAGLFYARAHGIKQFFGGVELDLIAQEPENLYVAPRSFFGTPAWVFSSNGVDASWTIFGEETNTLASSHGAADQAVHQMLGLRLAPRELVEIVLGKIDDRMGQMVDFKFSSRGQYYSLMFKNPFREITTLKIRSNDGALIEVMKLNQDGHLKYQVGYQDFVSVDDILFAKKWVIKTGAGVEDAELVLEGRDIIFNGPTFAPEIFRTVESLNDPAR